MIISGGMGINKGVELISPSGNVSCSLPYMPNYGRREHTHDNNIVCGGSRGEKEASDSLNEFDITSKTCVNLTSSGWVETNHSIWRWRHSSWPVDDGIILLGGDGDGSDADTAAELLKFDGNKELPFLLKYSTTM